MKARQERIIWACVIGVFLTVLAVWCRPVFYLNDDVTIRSILSGSYTGTPDGHAVYMKYPLTGVLSLLYRLVGFLPWLELFFAGSVWWALLEIVSNLKWKRTGLFFCILFVVPFWLYMHYTLFAAILAGTAAFLVCTEKKLFKSILFWLLAWTVRSQVAYLSLPFLGVAFLWRLLNVSAEGSPEELKCQRRESFKGMLKAGGLGLCGFLVCAGINSLCYAGEEWQSYLKYNDARTALYDYTDFLSTDAYAENYEQYGMSSEEFTVLNSYNTILDSAIDEMKIAEVADAVTEGMGADREEAAWLKECVKRYYYQIRYADNVYVILWIAIVVILAALLMFGKNWYGVILLGCLEAGRSLIWVFLIWKDRFPERVELSLYVIELLLLAGMLQKLPAVCAGKREVPAMREGKREVPAMHAGKQKVSAVCAAVGAIALISLLSVQIKTDWERAAAQNRVQEEWNALKEYCGNTQDKLYLMDVFSAVEYSDLPYRKDSENIMLAGGWMSASPLAEERLAAYGAADGAEALYENEQVVFLAEKGRDVRWLEEYLRKRFGQCKLQSAEEIVCGTDKVFVEYRVIAE